MIAASKRFLAQIYLFIAGKIGFLHKGPDILLLPALLQPGEGDLGGADAGQGTPGHFLSRARCQHEVKHFLYDILGGGVIRKVRGTGAGIP